MILRYSFPQFEQMILSGEKIHTFRQDAKKRWRAGMSIQHYMYSYMNPDSYKFLENECTAVQEVVIYRPPAPSKKDNDGWLINEIIISIDARHLTENEAKQCIKNDGLTQEEFIAFFVPEPGYVWNGRLIHWTKTIY